MSKGRIAAICTALIALTTASGGAAATTSILSFNANGVAQISNTFAAGLTTFDDFFTFEIKPSQSGKSTGSVVAGFDFNPANPQTVSFSAFDLYSGQPNAQGAQLLATGTIPYSFLAHVSANNLAAGNYFLEVAGSVFTPSQGGWYGGSLKLTTAPVPEPGEWALMLSGIALIGYVVRRRSTPTA